MSLNDQELIRLEGEQRKHELSLKTLEEKGRRKDIDIKHSEDDLRKHKEERSRIDVDISKEKAGIATIQAQKHAVEESAKREKEAARHSTENHH